MYFPLKMQDLTLMGLGVPVEFEKYKIKGSTSLYYGTRHHYRVFTQYIELEEFTIWLQVLDVKETVIVVPTALSPGLQANITLGNKDAHAMLNETELVDLESGKMDLFYIIKQTHDAVLPPGTHIFLHLDISDKQLELLEQYPKFSLLLNAIQHAKKKNFGRINSQPVSLSVHCGYIIEDIRQHNYNGVAANIYLRKKGLQLLEYFAEHFTKPPCRFPSINNIEAITILDIRKYISTNLKKTFSPDLISKEFGINDTRVLKRQFMQMTHMSIFDYRHYWLMERIFEAVINTDIPILFIAREYGYKNTATLAKAFRKYFDCSPAALRQFRRGPR